jgi:hypothetical protein
MNECKDDLEFASDLEALRNDLGVLSVLMVRQAERLNGSKKKKAAA